MFFPRTLMPDVVWSFSEAEFDASEDFVEVLRQDQVDIAGNADFDPDELVLLHPTLSVQCEAGDDSGDETLIEVGLAADDGHAFSAAELLFKLHAALAARLADQDHHFFEGLAFEGLRDGTPVYRVILGS